EAAPAPRAPRPPPRLSRRKRALVGAAVAASALLMWGPDWQAMQADHRSPTGEHRTVALSDGSQMLLDSNTLADVQFNPDQREVTLLRGQAFFSVTHDANRAFYVNAGDVRVRVTGTAFAVNLDDNGVDVSVESGTVAVQTPQASVSATHLLGHGDQLHFTANGQRTRIVQLPQEQIAPWRRWQLVAVDQSIDDVITQLRRYQPGLILLTDKALGQRRITAALNLRDPKRALQTAIAPLGGRLQDSVPYTLIVSTKP
ncbi:FecR domain-containing protein, partial [uncultured Pseudomonas sp.]|uniref:FecR family protein n=1 Tax=uncultured Pseudomonas sp. TaxID=114707 RepID=UPI0027DC4479